MNNTMRVLAIIILISSIGVASAVHKGITWNQPFVYGSYLKCGPVKEKLQQVKEEGKDHHKVTYLYLRVAFPKGQEDICVTTKTFNSSEVGKQVCFKEDLEVSRIEASCVVILILSVVLMLVNIVMEVFDIGL